MHRLKEWLPFVSAENLEKFELFHVELLKFNKKLNLISPKTIDSVADLHFADSALAIDKVLCLETSCGRNAEIYDIGSGNGFPGVILGILAKDRKVVLVESDRRKSEFIKHVASRLELRNLSVRTERFERLEENSIELGVCRAFAPLQRSIEWANRPFSANSCFFHLKGAGWESELADIEPALGRHWEISLAGSYSLPESGIDRFIVKSEKRDVPRGT